MPVVETGYKPAIGNAYPDLWTRDHAYAIWHDPTRLTAAQRRGFVAHRLAARSTGAEASPDATPIPANFIADRITANGVRVFKNANASALPFMDGIHFVVLALWADWNLTGHTATFTENKAAIDACLAAIPRSANGCVYSDPAAPSIDYGFTDGIKKTGDVAYGTCLQAWAYKMLAQIAGENGSGEYTTLRNAAQAGLATLRTPDGWYKGSSVNNATVKDVWATALAVAEELVTGTDRTASATVLANAYSARLITERGWVRHWLGSSWAGSNHGVGTYQNGGYWLTPLWDCYRAVALVNQALATKWAQEALREVDRQIAAEPTVGATTAPYEWFNGSTLSGPKGYTASAAIVRRFA